MITPWSFRLLVCSFLLWTLAVAERGRSKYAIMVPTEVESGRTATMTMRFPGAKEPVSLRLELMNREGKCLQKGQTYTFKPYTQMAIIRFPIAEKLRLSYYRYLYVNAWGGMEFLRFKRVYVKGKRMSLIIQTDKSEYKPGQTVKFRAMVVNPDSTLSNCGIRVTLTDPYYNEIAVRSRVVKDESRSRVFEGEITTSKGAVFGNWKIMATAEGRSEYRQITLADYDKLGHRVSTKFPRYAGITDKKLAGKVVVKFVNGFPIEGNVTVVTRMYYYSYYSRYSRYNTNVTISKSVQLVSGIGKVEFTIQELANLIRSSYKGSYYSSSYYTSLKYKTINSTVTFKNPLTDEVVSDSAFTTFYTASHYLRLLSPTSYGFKEGLPLILSVRAVPRSGVKLKMDNRVIRFEITYRFQRITKKYVVNKTMSSDATATVTLNPIPSGVTYLYYTVKDGQNTVYRYLRPFTSPSKTYLGLKVLGKPIVGKKLKVQVMCNKPLNQYRFQVHSKGTVLIDRKAKTNKKTAVMRIMVTKEMFPRNVILVYLETESGEYVADRTLLTVEPSPKWPTLKLKFNDKIVKPGQIAKLTVKAMRGSTVYLVGYNAAAGVPQNGASQEYYLDILKRLSGYSIYSYITSAYDVFKYSLINVMTDGIVPSRYSSYYTHYDMPRHYSNRTSYQYHRYIRYRSLPPVPGPPAKGVKRPLIPPQQKDKFLSKNFFWKTVEMRSKTKMIVEVETPTIFTRMPVFGFAVSPSGYLSLVNEPAEVETSQRLWMKTDLPRTAVRGEIVCFHVFIFVYSETNDTVKVEIKKDTSSFETVAVKNGKRVYADKHTEYLGMIKAGGSKITLMCIKPVRIGKMKIRLLAKGKEASDEVEETIEIKAEGVPQYKSFAVLRGTDSPPSVVDIQIPADAVNGSVTVDVAVTGHLLGVVANNLDNLLQVPYECGEQNMIHFTPQTYLLNYLKKTDRHPEDIVSKAKKVMMAAYQRQLNYQRFSGSFGPFGNRDTSGNTWLTAFIAKSFAQAVGMGVMTIERDIIYRALNWITRVQYEDGSFREKGEAIHPALQGENAGKIRLTAFVTICMADALISFPDDAPISLPDDDMYGITKSRTVDALSSAGGYLERQLPSVKKGDSYTACILAYALTLVKSDKAKTAIAKMKGMATTKGGVTYWGGLSKPHNIEMTSLAAMALQRSGSRTVGRVYAWLVTQMEAFGGFSSVLATSLTVEALANMPSGASVPSLKATAKYELNGRSTEETFKFDSSNTFSLKKKSIPSKDGKFPTKVTFIAESTASGKQTGYALFQMVVSYTVKSKKDPGFDINTMTSNDKPRKLSLETCVNTTQSNTIVATEVNLPTGYRLMKTTSEFGKVVGLGFEKGKVVLYRYGSKLAQEGDCSTLDMVISPVVQAKPTGLRVLALADPSLQTIDEYKTKVRQECDDDFDMPGCVKPK